MGRVTTRRPVLRSAGGRLQRRPDTLAVEEPLEIRVDGIPLSVTMRTPGDDFDLAAGFLTTEGLLGPSTGIAAIRHCADLENLNVVDVTLRSDDGTPVEVGAGVSRALYTASSCGVCGKASLDAVRVASRWPVADDPVVLDAATVTALPDRLRAAQKVFDRTGGLHAAGLFGTDGSLLAAREDVGRHNAVDKVIGWALRSGRLPARGCVLMVSGRASFELVQKAVTAGIPVLAAVSAPSSLAAELAADAGLTLVGFLRGDSMNVYTGEQRIAFPAPDGRVP